MKKIRVAIIGYGFSGRVFHMTPLSLNEHFQVVKVMTKNPENQASLKENFSDVTIISSYEEAILDPTIDLVVIATSNDVHYEYTKLALQNKKHVVCEKPFVETYNEALELFNLADENQVLLKVYHNRKFDGDILTIKNMLKENDFGKILSFNARFDRYVKEISKNWRFKATDMAGIFYDLAPHLVYHAIELFGLPTRVYNQLYFDRDGSVVDDHFEMTLTYESGLVCHLGSNMLDRNPRPRFEIVGTKSTYVKYGFDNPDLVYSVSDEVHQNNNLRSELINEDLSVTKIPLLIGKHYDFYNYVANEIESNNYRKEDCLFALNVIKVMEKALESNQKNTSVKIQS